MLMKLTPRYIKMKVGHYLFSVQNYAMLLFLFLFEKQNSTLTIPVLLNKCASTHKRAMKFFKWAAKS